MDCENDEGFNRFRPTDGYLRSFDMMGLKGL